MPINDPKTCPFKHSHRFKVGHNNDLYITTHKKCTDECKDQFKQCLSGSYQTFRKANGEVLQEIENYTVYINRRPPAIEEDTHLVTEAKTDFMENEDAQ